MRQPQTQNRPPGYRRPVACHSHGVGLAADRLPPRSDNLEMSSLRAVRRPGFARFTRLSLSWMQGKVLNFLARLWRLIGFRSNHLAVKFVNRIITFRHLAQRSYATHSLCLFMSCGTESYEHHDPSEYAGRDTVPC